MPVNALYLEDWTVHAVEKTNGTYRLVATYDAVPDACPKCGVVGKPYGHGPIQIDYVDAPVHGLPTVVAVTAKRFRCRHCGKTFMQPLPDMHPDRRMTMRCFDHIREQGFIQTYAALARQIGVDEKTVRDVCDEEIARIEAEHRPVAAPVALGIDELHLRGQKRTIFTNVGERKIIDIIDAMNRKPVDRWLYRLPDKERVRIVTMDMWGPYREAVKAIMPNATIIVDKWHVVSKVNQTLDVIRNRQRRAATGKARRNPWDARRLVQASRMALTPRRKLLLNGMLSNNELLNAAWQVKEGFYDIWGYEVRPSRHEAETMFDAWAASIPEEVKDFRAVARTVENWRDEIFAYFDYPFTNAYTEAANGLIKMANRAGRGYSFRAIRARALAMPLMGTTHFAVCGECLARHPVMGTGMGRDRIDALSLRLGKPICGHCKHLDLTRRFHMFGKVRAHDASTS